VRRILILYKHEEVIVQIWMLAEELGKAPTMMDFMTDQRMASLCHVKRCFGSWNNFLEIARLKPNRIVKV
jgi:hypothetical protein